MENSVRFLDLPAEVRDQVYYEILCTWPAYKSTWDEEKQQAVVPTDVAVMDRKIETAILRINRQVYQEAKTVMLKGNQFIRVSVKGFQPLQVLFIPSQVPVVTMNQDGITKYKGFVMTHSIDITDDPAPLKRQFEVMILRRDLDRFAQALAKADAGSPNFAATSKHTVTLHNPFVGTLTPKFLDSKNQVRLTKQVQDINYSHNSSYRSSFWRHTANIFFHSRTSKSTARSKQRLQMRCRQKSSKSAYQIPENSSNISSVRKSLATNITSKMTRSKAPMPGVERSYSCTDLQEAISGLASRLQAENPLRMRLRSYFSSSITMKCWALSKSCKRGRLRTGRSTHIAHTI